MKHFGRKVGLTSILAVFLVIAFSWIVVLQNYHKLSQEAAKEKPHSREAVDYTLRNLAAAWNDYEAKITNRYEMEAVFSSLALQGVIDDGGKIAGEVPEADSALISIVDGKLSAPDAVVGRFGLDRSLFQGRSGSFAAPDEPSTFVVYSRIPDTDYYYVKWNEDTVIGDVVKENLDIPGILKSTEIPYDVSALFVLCDEGSPDLSGSLYKTERCFSDCETLEDLGLSMEDLKKKEGESSGTLTFEDASFSYVSGKSELPAGYVILTEPLPNLYARAFGQAGYMIAAVIVLLTTLLVTGFSLFPYVHDNLLTPEQEKAYSPSHVRSLRTLFAVVGILVIALTGMFIYALNGLYDNALRGKERLATLDDSLLMYTDRYGRNIQFFDNIYLEFGGHIAEFLDTCPELRDSTALSTLADCINVSSITLYDSRGRETVSSGPWIDLQLGTDPESPSYDFRRILKGVQSILQEPQMDEVTGENALRIGIRIQDEDDPDRYGVMILSVDDAALTDRDSDPEKAVREILQNLSDPETTIWIADAATGKVLVSGDQALEGKSITELGLSESDLKGSLMKTLKTEEGSFFVASTSMDPSGSPEWIEKPEGVIAYYKGPETPVLPGMLFLALTGCVLFGVIYSILAWIIFSGYTDDYFSSCKRVNGSGNDSGRKKGPLRRALSATPPGKRGLIAMEIVTAVFLLLLFLIMNTGSFATQNTVYHYISAGAWERGFNLFALAAILILLSKVVLLVVAVRLVFAVCASFAGSKGKTIFRLLCNVALYIALFFFLIKAFEFLGFSPAAIAAGMGSLALAVSLGAQNFVADIFAGLTFVFEGTVHVGDTVQIAVIGCPVYQGKILEIGVRCVKVLNQEGDLITCGNRDIRMIKNSTQLNSHVICELVVSSDLSASDIERMLKEDLPKVGREERRILNGPFYNGITALGSGTMTLSVSAECREEDYSYVRDRLNASLQRIFREHGYSI